MEIVMSQPGSDSGQLPILDLLGNVRDESAADPQYDHLHACADQAFSAMVTLLNPENHLPPPISINSAGHF